MAFTGGSARAGAYAEGRYRRGLRHWRSRTRLIIAACLGPFIAVGLVGLMIEGHAAAWIAGVVFGLGTGVLMTVRESPPSYIENWRIGAEGERKTEKALKKLERSRWVVDRATSNLLDSADQGQERAPGQREARRYSLAA